MTQLFRLLLIALALLSGCRPSSPSPEPAVPAAVTVDPALLSGTNALAEVDRFVAISPRIPGTGQSAKAALHIQQRLEAIGLEPEMDRFTNSTPAGMVGFCNVVATVPGSGEGLVVLLSHTDTKPGLPDGFVGANDSGSSVGLLLEFARVLRNAQRTGPGILLAFVDGEECRKTYGSSDGLHGSRRLVAWLHERQLADHVHAAIVLDMVGDRNLSVTIPRNSSAKLVSMAFQAATAEGVRTRFSLYGQDILDDHDSFLNAGIPAIDLIDFNYGSRPGANDYWHTTDDTMDKLSAESLQAMGRVVLRMVNRLSASIPVHAVP